MAVPNNYIDKIKKDGDSRMISPAADMVRVDNDNFEGTDLDEVLDEVAQAIGEAGEGGYAPPAGGIPKTDLASGVQTSLGKADSAIQGVKVNGTELTPDANKKVDVTVPTKLSDLAADENHRVVTDAEKSTWSGKQSAINDLDTIRSGAGKGTTSVQTISVNGGTAQQPTNGVVNLTVAIAADMVRVNNDNFNGADLDEVLDDVAQAIANAGSGAVSVTTNQDGTFVIHVGETDYTINLNHTHLNMCELVVCEESDLPSTLEASTIYAVKNGDETGIETVYFGGLPFTASAPQQLPYDAEVEYLQSTGTQYIGTGVQMESTFKCEIKAQFDQNNDGFDTLVGALDGSTNYGVVLGLKNSNGGGSIYSQIGGNESIADCAATPLALHVFTTRLMNGTISIDADGVSGTHAFSGSLPTNSLFLFARNKATVGNFCNAKIYYCKIWSDGVLVRNFIPVRVGQVGYMYDKVSKQLFKNIGTGNFTLGNDKQ